MIRLPKTYIIGRPLLALMAVASLLAIMACAPTPAVKPPPVPEPTAKPSVQDERAMASYGKILEMTRTKKKRTILPEMELAYKALIAQYPETFIAQESYWRLILINLNDYAPPRIEVANGYYEEFNDRYPDSRLKLMMDDTLVRFYHRTRLWDRLLAVTTPYARDYINTGVLKTPMFIYFYAEAKLHLGDKVEARKGYKIVLKIFPASSEARLSAVRLDELAKESRQGDL